VVSGRIVLFGATGYTGALTARAMVAAGHLPMLAGRDGARLQRLAAELGGLDTRVADAARPDTVAGLVERGDVLVSTVGPFRRFGEPAVRAAVSAGAHYLDSTGETAFIREVFQRHGPVAARARCALLTAFGYDWVPGNLAGALALREAGSAATRVEIGYFVTGRGAAASGGTRASAAGMLLEPSVAWRGGRLVDEPVARHVRAFCVGGEGGGRPAQRREAVSAGGSEHLALPRVHAGLRDVRVFLGLGSAARPVQALALGASTAARVPGVRRALTAAVGRAVPVSTGGQDAAARARTGCLVVAEAFGGDGARLSAVRLQGPNPYDLTAALLAWGAGVAARGELRGTGALGPVDGLGLEALEQGCRTAGLVRM
jgi:short subunit dehydrogenase-like uncharacterized protein